MRSCNKVRDRLVFAPFKSSLCLIVVTTFVAGCASQQLGPRRPITIDDEVAWSRTLAEPDLSLFYSASSDGQSAIRNQILTARMYIADMEYNTYEARLTREIQDEGLLATAASLGLTTSATLVSPAQTKAILSGIATGVTGLDKAYNEKVLLSNTIQALQTQMRADRKTQAAVIFAKMFKNTGNARIITPIAEYTLPMALSDAEIYYQAGTVASGLIGLSKTVANVEQSADQAKSLSGPNPNAVSSTKTIAAPISRPSTVIRDVNEPLVRTVAPKQLPTATRLGRSEADMSGPDMRWVLDTLCRPVSERDLGPTGSPARKALAKFLADNMKRSVEILDRNAFLDIQDLNPTRKRICS